MAFRNPFIGRTSGNILTSYNVDFSVGAGVRGNLPADVMLVQALFRIVHFEVKNPVPPPPGETGIEVDGKFGPQTHRFILSAQQRIKKANVAKVLLDGIVDPVRSHRELSHIAKVAYLLEVLNDTCAEKCKVDGIDNYSGLPSRSDIPSVLAGELNQPQRQVAKQYQSEFRD